MSAWSADEVAILEANYPNHGASWVGFEQLLPGRSKSAIASKAKDLLLETERDKRRRATFRPKAPDKREGAVMRRMRQGMAPSQIDRDMGMVNGTAREIVTDMWARIKAAPAWQIGSDWGM